MWSRNEDYVKIETHIRKWYFLPYNKWFGPNIFHRTTHKMRCSNLRVDLWCYRNAISDNHDSVRSGEGEEIKNGLLVYYDKNNGLCVHAGLINSSDATCVSATRRPITNLVAMTWRIGYYINIITYSRMFFDALLYRIGYIFSTDHTWCTEYTWGHGQNQFFIFYQNVCVFFYIYYLNRNNPIY